MESDKTYRLVPLDKEDLQVLCESMWHSLQRADIPAEDRERMSRLRERLVALPELKLTKGG